MAIFATTKNNIIRTGHHDRNMKNLSDALHDINWSEMVRVSGYISDQVIHHVKNDEPVDRDSVAQLLTEMADDISREIEVEKSAQTEPE